MKQEAQRIQLFFAFPLTDILDTVPFRDIEISRARPARIPCRGPFWGMPVPAADCTVL